MLTRAVHLRASDVHIEPQEDSVVVRYRIDGVLHEAMRLPSAHHPGLVSRIKVLAGLDIAERRLPQDGRLTVRVDDRPVDLRVATIPGAWGEDVILRVLDRGGKLLSLEALGFPESVRRGFEGAVRRPFGCVLVTGPTGAGKSTTLYATLQIVDDESKKIVTVEDPIEYRFQRLRQMQVHPAIGLTFARALRSILRADPDVVMVGEIRDSETATIAIHAALTGHIVLSTLHTNDAPTGPTRLVEMGVEPYLVASALECVLAQRLVRRLCTRCKVEDRVPEGVREEFGVTDPYMPIFRPGGCGHCAGTGYRGRLAVVELMVMSEQLKSLTMERRPSEELRAVALRQGMRPLRQAGIDFVKSGDTSLEELLRVLS
jgi:type IV pilus assembly protein PilB